MKLVVVSDPHLVAPGGKLFGSDPLRRLEACIADINANNADADLVIFCGDLANDCEPPAYAALAGCLGDLAPPYRLTVGNHDDRAALIEAIPEVARSDGFIQSALDIGGTRLIVLDTLWPGNVAGTLCDRRLGWLDAQLAGAGRALLFLHHPPMAIGIPSVDDSRLAAPERLLAVINRHGNVRHVFAGHVHRLSHGNWNGVPVTTLRGTNHQTALAFSGPHKVSHEAPAYAVVLAQGDELIVHTREFPTEG